MTVEEWIKYITTSDAPEAAQLGMLEMFLIQVAFQLSRVTAEGVSKVILDDVLSQVNSKSQILRGAAIEQSDKKTQIRTGNNV